MIEKPLLVEETTKSAINIRNEMGGDALEFSFIEQVSDLTVRFVEIDGLVRVMLEIGDKATHKDIRDAIPNILKWRDKVQEKQSDKTAARLFHKMLKPENKEELLEFFSYLQEHGVSYAKLAERFNGLLSRSLEAILMYQNKRLTTKQMANFNLVLNQTNNLLNAMNINNVDIEYALDQIAAGKPPFEKGYPVSRYKMIEVLRTWRKNKQHIMVKTTLEKAKRLQEKKEADKV